MWDVVQAERMRRLGWGEFLTVQMKDKRQTMVVEYWVRKPQPPNQRQRQRQPQKQFPLLGGRLTISIVQVKEKTGRRAMRSPKARVLAELQGRSRLENSRPSDEVEHMRFDVKWEPEPGALGVMVGDMYIPPEQLHIVR